jgi:integrase/recombinase XerD
MADRSAGAPRYMEAGSLQSFVEAFSGTLQACRHSPLTVAGYTDSARHFSVWLRRSRISLDQIDRETLQRFAQHRCRCRCGGGKRQVHVSARYVRRVSRFIAFLAEREVIDIAVVPVCKDIDPHIAAYQHWLRHHRGISDRTIDRHGRMITRLLPRLGNVPEHYNASVVLQTILDEARVCSPAQVKTIATALRGYLQFLTANGLCRPNLDDAVPTVPQWHLSALPRYLPSRSVDRLIDCCDLTTAHGIRDRAILLLLARLGLRAGDIIAMHISDISWKDGTLRVCGKGRQEVTLPLPQDAGEALLEYVLHARPHVDDDVVFLRSRAPYRRLQSSTNVSNVVRLALRRAGIDDAPTHGANLLRYSAATSMLRAGASLDAVGAVLRHRSIDTTAHYAKVDILMLQQIAQPWPGGVSC